MAGAVVVVVAAVAIVLAGRARHAPSSCGAGFVADGPRCRIFAGMCPPPLVITPHGCEAAEHDVVELPAATLAVGPSDWEAEGRVAARTIHVEAFAIDRLEETVGQACAVLGADPRCGGNDAARALSNVAHDEAGRLCAAKGGRLPTEDEWMVAAMGDRGRRYPWGDTGAVCRRAAWGLASGPCAEGATGPDTVGAHPDGRTPTGIYDLAGNVDEWVCSPPGCRPVARGGSWKTSLATDLRTWLGRETNGAADPTIGFRCAYSRVR